MPEVQRETPKSAEKSVQHLYEWAVMGGLDLTHAKEDRDEVLARLAGGLK